MVAQKYQKKIKMLKKKNQNVEKKKLKIRAQKSTFRLKCQHRKFTNVSKKF